MRNLAHIEIIEKLELIPNADFLEKATILGWECVVKKDEFKVGDKCVYIETDSILPAIEYFDFMEKRRYRVKIIKLKKQVSQGLVIPLSDVEVIVKQLNKNIDQFGFEPSIGVDLTKCLGIIKYDSQSKEENLLITNKQSKNFIHKYLMKYSWYRKLQVKTDKGWPSWIQKTDEERIQNIPRTLDRLANEAIYVTEKLDGQSASYSFKLFKKFKFFKEWKFYVCSRNICLRKPSNNSYWSIAKSLDIENKLRKYGKQITIQGEIIGPGIQKNKYNLNEYKFYVYNIHKIDSDTHCGCIEIQEICKTLGLDMVPIVFTGILSDFAKNISEIVEKSAGNSILIKRQREGIVARRFDSSFEHRAESFKVINPTFLLGLDDDE